MARVEKHESGCWLWNGPRNPKGYPGQIGCGDGSIAPAHRASFMAFVGPIEPGLEVDHVCRRRDCVNPDHLRAITHLENVRAGEKATKTHCVNGHPLSGDNLLPGPLKKRGHRQCRACQAAANARSFRKRYRPASACNQGERQERITRAVLGS